MLAVRGSLDRRPPGRQPGGLSFEHNCKLAYSETSFANAVAGPLTELCWRPERAGAEGDQI